MGASRLEDLLASATPVTLAALGGIEAVVECGELAESRFFDEVVRCIADDGTALHDRRLQDFVLHGFELCAYPATLGDAIDALLETPALAQCLGTRLSSTLCGRLSERESQPLACAFALEGAVRLAVAGYATHYLLVGTMEGIRGDEPALFASRAARLIGVVNDRWRTAELRAVLERLLTNEEAASDVSFELGMLELSFALDESSVESVSDGLRAARVWFARAECASEMRHDAIAHCAMIDACLAFVHPSSATTVEFAVARFAQASAMHDAWNLRPNSPEWLRPRIDANAEWKLLLQELSYAAPRLTRESWMDAAVVLPRVVALYRASRAIRGGGLGEIVEPAIKSAFISKLGLFTHLTEWVESGAAAATDRDAARAMLEHVRVELNRDEPSVAPSDSDEIWKPIDLVLGHRLRASLTESGHESALPILRDALITHPLVYAESPILSQTLERLDQELRASDDYVGDARDAFLTLVRLTTQFLHDRQDVQRSTVSARGAYLFAPPSGVPLPLENELGRDYRDFLVGSSVGRNVQAELRDIAGGRADVAVTLRYRFIAELKRELEDASRASLARYLGQAGLYSGTDLHLGLLLVLDLTPKTTGVPSFRDNLWVESIPGERVRHVVVVRVPGNRIDPSATATPGVAATRENRRRRRRASNGSS